MIMAPWLTHLSITFLFSGSDGVSFGPPGISTCVMDSCHYITLLFSLLYSPGRYRQSAHGTRRRDDHCGSEQAPCQRGSHLASTLSPGRYFLQHVSLNSEKSFSFCFGYFCLPPSTWWQGVMDELCLEPSLTKTGSHLGKHCANSEDANLLFSWTGNREQGQNGVIVVVFVATFWLQEDNMLWCSSSSSLCGSTTFILNMKYITRPVWHLTFTNHILNITINILRWEISVDRFTNDFLHLFAILETQAASEDVSSIYKILHHYQAHWSTHCTHCVELSPSTPITFKQHRHLSLSSSLSHDSLSHWASSSSIKLTQVTLFRIRDLQK